MGKVTTVLVFLIVATLLGTSALASTNGCTGCTPGYWKQSQHFGSWNHTPYSTTDTVSAAFGCGPSDMTLLQALQQGGSGKAALMRHAVAALLNVNHPGVNYPGDDGTVKDLFCYAMTSFEYESAKNNFEERNERYCPLGGAPAD